MIIRQATGNSELGASTLFIFPCLSLFPQSSLFVLWGDSLGALGEWQHLGGDESVPIPEKSPEANITASVSQYFLRSLIPLLFWRPLRPFKESWYWLCWCVSRKESWKLSEAGSAAPLLLSQTPGTWWVCAELSGKQNSYKPMKKDWKISKLHRDDLWVLACWLQG